MVGISFAGQYIVSDRFTVFNQRRFIQYEKQQRFDISGSCIRGCFGSVIIGRAAFVKNMIDFLPRIFKIIAAVRLCARFVFFFITLCIPAHGKLIQPIKLFKGLIKISAYDKGNVRIFFSVFLNFLYQLGFLQSADSNTAGTTCL